MNAHIKVLHGELDLLAMQTANQTRYPYFLDSAAHGDCYTLDRNDPTGKTFYKKSTKLGRYSILFACPQGDIRLDANWQLQSDFLLETHADSFLDAIDYVWRNESKDKNVQQALPFRGGWLFIWPMN